MDHSTLTAASWLEAGEAFLSAEDHQTLRVMVARQLEQQEASVQQRLAHLRAQIAMVRGDDHEADDVEVAPDSGQRARVEVPPSTLSLPELVKAFLRQMPEGASSNEIIAHIDQVRPKTDGTQVHSTLYRLTKPKRGEPQITKSGSRGSFIYRMIGAETDVAMVGDSADAVSTPSEAHA